MNEEQERCPKCKARKFDPPKRKCSTPDFHWLLAGREWQLNDDQWVPVETKHSRETSFDGLLNRERLKKEAAEIGRFQIGEVILEARVVGDQIKVVNIKEK